MNNFFNDLFNPLSLREFRGHVENIVISVYATRHWNTDKDRRGFGELITLNAENSWKKFNIKFYDSSDSNRFISLEIDCFNRKIIFNCSLDNREKLIDVWQEVRKIFKSFTILKQEGIRNPFWGWIFKNKYWILLILIIFVIFQRQLDWTKIFDPKYWITEKLNIPFKNNTAQSNKDTPRPIVYIEPDKIEYSNWSEKEKLDDPAITSRCEKIILYFWIRNNTTFAANNVDIKAISSILQEKSVGKFSPSDFKNSYEHNLHLVTGENPGRQPFVLALDKKAVIYFNDGTVKVKLIVNINYSGLNDSKKY